MHSKSKSERELRCDLTDFQVLHQNNELIFKHSFGSDLTQLDDDKSLNLHGGMKIWSMKMNQQSEDCKSISAKLNNLLFILESKACLQIVQNLNLLRNITVKSAPRMFSQANKAQAQKAA